MQTSIRTRFAPSPTGYMHLGNIWVAFLNWLWTRQHGGAIVLRIEDIDRQRSHAVHRAALQPRGIVEIERLRTVGKPDAPRPDVDIVLRGRDSAVEVADRVACRIVGVFHHMVSANRKICFIKPI